MKEELRELYFKTHSLHGTTEYAVFGVAAKPRNLGTELSVDATQMLKRAFSLSPTVCHLLYGALAPAASPAARFDSHSALGALVQDVIDSLISQRRLESACQHIMLPLGELQRLGADDPESATARSTLTRLAAALHRDDSAAKEAGGDGSRAGIDQLVQEMLAKREGSPRPTSPSLLSPPASPQPSLSTLVSAADIGNLALRVRIYEALMQLPGDAPLRLFSQLEDAQLQRQFGNKSAAFPSFMLLFPAAAEVAAGGDLAERRQASYWGRLFHFVRTTKRHFLDYALDTALRLAAEGKLSEASALLRPFPHLAPLLVVMAWQTTLARAGVAQLAALLETFPPPAQPTPVTAPLVQKIAELSLQLRVATWSAQRLLEVRAKSGKLTLGTDDVDLPAADVQQLAATVLRHMQESEEGAPRSLVFLLSRVLPDLPLLDLIAALTPTQPLPAATLQALNRDVELLRAFGALSEALALVVQAGDAVAPAQLEAARVRIATHVQGIGSHPAVRIHVLEQLAGLLLLDSSRVAARAAEATATPLVTEGVARLLVAQVRTSLAEVCEAERDAKSLRLRAAWAALCLPAELDALAVRAARLAALVEEAELRFVVLSACAVAAADWPAAFVMPPPSLLSVCVRASAWVPARQVAQLLKERIPAEAVADARLREHIDSLHSTLARPAFDLPQQLEAVLACLAPPEALLLLGDLALTAASAPLASLLAKRAQEVADALQNRCGASAVCVCWCVCVSVCARVRACVDIHTAGLTAHSAARSQQTEACRALLARYALLASSQAPPASLRAAVCGVLTPLPSADAGSADAALSSLQSHKLLLESLTRLRTTLAQLEQGADVGDTGTLIASLIPKVSLPLPGSARPSRAYLAEFLAYVQRTADVALAPTRNHFAVLQERIGAAAVRLAQSGGGTARMEALAKAAGVAPAQLLASHVFLLRGSAVPLPLLEYVAASAPLAAAVAAVLCIPPQPTHDTVLLYLNLALLSAEGAAGSEHVRSWVRLKAAFYAQLYAALPPPPRRRGTGTGAAGSAREPSDLAHLALLVADETALRPVEGVRKLAERLAAAGQHEQAAALADAFLPGGAGDALLVAALDNAPQLDAGTAAAFVGRLTDPLQMAEYVLRLYFLWSLETCLRLAHTALARVPAAAACVPALRKLVAQMTCFDDILRRNPQRWKRPGPPEWLYIHEKCCGDLPPVISSLLEAPADFGLARRALSLFGNSLPQSLLAAQEREVTVAALLSALQRGNEAEALLLLAEPGHDSAAVARAALDRKPPFLARAQLVNFLRTQHPPASAAELAALSARESSLRLLAGLPSELAAALSHLEGEPLLLTESLLMNELLADIEALLRGPSPPPADLLLLYARKAVTVRPAKPAPPPAGGLWVLTGNAEQDAQIRARHTFASAPSTYLVKALLELANEPARGALVCLEACRPLSEMLLLPTTTDAAADGPAASLLHLLGLVQQLLLHAKLLLIRDSDLAGSNAGQGAALADTLLQHADLFRSLITLRLPISMSLADFTDPVKARQLRSALLSEDRHAAALDVAVRCGVETHPVWTAWGLALLRVGKYADARDKFAAALRAPPAAVGVGAATTDPQSLLPRVLEALECRREVRADHLDSACRQLREQLHEFAARHGGGRPRPAAPSPKASAAAPRTPSQELPPPSPSGSRVQQQMRSSRLESAREAECLYYLERYGGPRDFLEFFLRHGQVEEALHYMLKQHLAPSIFVNLIFSHCLCHQRFPQLLTACRAVDRTGAATRDYLQALCNYLRKRQTWEILLEVQVSMGETSRAGLTCLELFATTPELPLKAKFLEQARNHFKDALSNSDVRNVMADAPASDEPAPPATEGELAKYIKTINLQLDVTLFLQSQTQAKQPPPPRILSVTLLGSVSHCTEIAEYLLTAYAYDLGIRVIQECRLPITSIYSSAAGKIARKRLESKLQEMLKAVKGTLPDEDWDEVLLACIRVYARELDDLKTAEKFAAKLSREESRVDAFIICGKLKSAYISAVKDNLIEKIKVIRDEAIRRNDTTVVQLCDKFLYLQAGPKPVGQSV